MQSFKSLFVGSGTFMKAPKNSISTLVVDEAHRLTKQTGFLKMGENQVKEIIDASLCSIFFIDEDQRVHIDDYGERLVIKELAEKSSARRCKRWISLPNFVVMGPMVTWPGWIMCSRSARRQTTHAVYFLKILNMICGSLTAPPF